MSTDMQQSASASVSGLDADLREQSYVLEA